MTMPINAVQQRLFEIFMPLAHERTEFVKKNKLKFVHYTTAENALNILRSRRVYMRNTTCMNDYREFQHGLEYLIHEFSTDEKRKQFFDVMNRCGDGIGQEAVGLFDGWLPHNQFNVYVTCLSEHDPSEDQHGRLSMWRAYRRPDAVGVALVLKQEPFWQTSNTFKTFGSPVSYLSNEEFATTFKRVLDNAGSNCEFLKGLPRQQLIGNIFNTLLFAAVCLKHPGFAEEREWRLIHLPKMNPSTVLEQSVETIGGVPQLVYKIPLVDRPQDGLMNIEPAKLLDKVIIGPSVYPLTIYEAFVAELTKAGVDTAREKVVISSIPLRTPN